MEVSTDYDDIFNNMPIEVIYHLKKLIHSTGMPDDEQNFNRFMESWLTKRNEFNRISIEGNYSQKDSFEINNKNSCIALTISGSLVTLGPLKNGKRSATYTSIGMRTDVPMVRNENESELDADIEIHKSIFFKKGPVSKTSIILEIAVMEDEIDEEKQIRELSSANDFLLKRFIDINVDFLSDKFKESALIKRNDLFNKWVILTWFQLGGIEEYIFFARTKLLWLELFIDVYDLLSEKDITAEQRDMMFLELTNSKFIEYVDLHKWIKSRTENLDIGLLNILEDIPGLESYMEFCDFFINEKNK